MMLRISTTEVVSSGAQTKVNERCVLTTGECATSEISLQAAGGATGTNIIVRANN